jgi:hypothetical protein
MGILFATRYAGVPYPVESAFWDGMPLASALTRLSSNFWWIAAICAGVFVLWTLVIVVQLTVKYTPATNRNYLSAQIFLVVGCGITISGEALAGYIAAWLFALSVRQFAFSLHKGYRFAEVFRAGFYLGLIPLLYAPAAMIAILAVPVALVIYRRSLREFVVCLTGLAVPVPAAGFVYWSVGENGDFIYRKLWRAVTTPVMRTMLADVSVSQAVLAGFVVVLVLVGVYWISTHKKGIRKSQYKFMSHTSVLFAITAASIIIPGTSPTFLPVIAVPVALCLPYAFSGKLITFSSIIYFVVIAGAFALNLLPFTGFKIP